jgi:uncharacterized protein
MITLIGKNIATKNLEFTFLGAAKECDKCRFKDTCIKTLEKGRLYTIKNVKDVEHPCFIHEGGKVKVIEVEKANIKALVESKKSFEGSSMIFEFQACDLDCSLKDFCFPEGLVQNDRCKIVKNIGKPGISCMKGYDLSFVILKQ